ncbi:MAG: hypothetical protein QM780_01940 [Hyphomicrobium sp.]|uniref:hypothetical protein n=1 Tax=Hyphomicrobium sp. TaxID=82 RepID=UPI0039E67F6B
MRRLTILPLLLCVMPCVASAEDVSKTASESKPLAVISPIFGQLVMFSLPTDFKTVFEQPTADRYIREAVLKGETVDKWSQMITVTGAKGLAAKPEMSAQYFAAQIASGFQKACPATFNVKPMGPVTISGQDGFVAIASCGKVEASADKHSETALIIAIKGTADVYTIQWAERTPANAENLTIDESKWKARLSKLAPVRLCAIKPGEAPPYPSCINE